MRSKIKNFGEFEDFCQKHGLSRALNDILNIMSDSKKKNIKSSLERFKTGLKAS